MDKVKNSGGKLRVNFAIFGFLLLLIRSHFFMHKQEKNYI